MSGFDDRERAEEAKFAMDSATEFRVMGRRNKLLGLWAADLMNLSGAEAEAYAKTVVLSAAISTLRALSAAICVSVSKWRSSCPLPASRL